MISTRQIYSSLAVLLVSDVEVSQQFYREILGCEVTEWWVIRDGFTGLGIKLLQAESAEDVRPNRGAPNVYCYVENWAALDELYAEFKEKGASMAVEPHINETAGPWKEFVLSDPDGYRIAFGGTDGNQKKE